MKYFVVSDIHSCYTPLKEALDHAGYDKNDPNHTLIVDGDLFDRGDETLELYEYISSIPEDRLVLIRGNHEDLYLELLDKDIPDNYDITNGTVKTFLAIAGLLGKIKDHHLIYTMWNEIVDKVKGHPITKFIKSKRWVNYFEVGSFICTHSWFPNTNWRNEEDPDLWKKAHFDYVLYHANELNKYIGDKTLISGHLHSCFYHQLLNPSSKDNDDIFHINNLYVIDTYVMRSHKIGVLIIHE